MADPNRFKGVVPFYLLYHRSGDPDRLGRGLWGAGVDPGAVLPDVGDLHQEGIKPGFLGGGAEGGLVHGRGTGGYHHPGESMFLDRLLD